uniref:glycosyltransferase family 2 protein n=1 Tax=Enterocloster clostridioformis TaxID=1531 RepID=UPI0026F20600|nr:glycosyltransferase [Enterocloster clostridioformis]
MKIAFVVLHYLAEIDTIECIESIKNNMVYDDIEIVVVDNASSNNSFFNIKEKYQKEDKIHLIENSINLGYARGNNVGFRFAKNELKADFIVIINNDTIIRQKNFADAILQKYYELKFYVLGPDIVTKDGYHQNPLKHRDWTVNSLRLFKLKALLRLYDQKMLGISSLLVKQKQKKTALTSVVKDDLKGVRLHGACLIFSPDYVRRFDGLDEATFLYMEEDLLQMEMDYFGCSMWYTGDLQIFHKEDASTNMLGGSNKEKKIRFLNNLINSINACIERAKTLKGGR